MKAQTSRYRKRSKNVNSIKGSSSCSISQTVWRNRFSGCTKNNFRWQLQNQQTPALRQDSLAETSMHGHNHRVLTGQQDQFNFTNPSLVLWPAVTWLLRHHSASSGHFAEVQNYSQQGTPPRSSSLSSSVCNTYKPGYLILHYPLGPTLLCLVLFLPRKLHMSEQQKESFRQEQDKAWRLRWGRRPVISRLKMQTLFLKGELE